MLAVVRDAALTDPDGDPAWITTKIKLAPAQKIQVGRFCVNKDTDGCLSV
jgi:hypothetical protein